MLGESIRDEDIITKEQFLDLSNVVSGYITNNGSNKIKYGLGFVNSSKTLHINSGNTRIKEGTKVKISFPYGSSELHYVLQRFVKSPCNCKK